MNFNLSFHLTSHWLIALAMLAVLFAAVEFGFRAGVRKRGIPDADRSLMSGTGAAMLGLMGLLLGFTLSMAIGRWDDRRAIIIDESNAIGTLWLRAGFIKEPVRSQLRSTLQEYNESRIVLGGARDDLETWRAARKQSEMLHAEIWSAIEHVQGAELSNATVSSLITAANALIDIHEIRLASIDNYLPVSLMMLLLGVAAVAVSFVAWSFGAGTHDSRKAILMLGVLITSVLLLIMDVNRPQRGFVSVGVGPLERVQNSMADLQMP